MPSLDRNKECFEKNNWILTKNFGIRKKQQICWRMSIKKVMNLNIAILGPKLGGFFQKRIF